eukprot:CAMPEP_0172596936 /NCGR_PEP_ID=MMETSP1068-20121228/16822_1 /TAXON_ID=35684 /ORGANISM="Pseudopedinella elastica, Strain CCMP716" /LENGTH=45 /DNA_ID= /DNA_START= /DNA_END= /DNA_ORIENTATION=
MPYQWPGIREHSTSYWIRLMLPLIIPPMVHWSENKKVTKPVQSTT